MSHVSVLRWEVLRQLLGVVAGWLPQVLLVLFSYYLLGIVYRLVLNRSLAKFLESAVGGLSSSMRDCLGSDLPSSFVSKDRGILFRVLKVAVLLLVGYYLGYYLNAMYISGDITLITSVSRISTFYSLAMWIFELFIFVLSLVLILGTSLRLMVVDSETYLSSRSYRVTTVLLALFRYIAYGLVIVIPLASIIVSYLGLANS